MTANTRLVALVALLGLTGGRAAADDADRRDDAPTLTLGLAGDVRDAADTQKVGFHRRFFYGYYPRYTSFSIGFGRPFYGHSSYYGFGGFYPRSYFYTRSYFAPSVYHYGGFYNPFRYRYRARGFGFAAFCGDDGLDAPARRLDLPAAPEGPELPPPAPALDPEVPAGPAVRTISLKQSPYRYKAYGEK